MYALLCYIAWGVFPLFWKLIHGIPAQNILAHRIVWSFVFLLLLVLLLRNKTFFTYLKQPKLLAILTLAGAVIGLNWGVYIYAVETNHIVEAGLGYYINPLVNVLFGALFLKERLNRLQLLAVALALIGVGYFTISHGSLPWISLILATTFGLYGLIKKKAGLESIPALTIETMMLAPIALGFLIYSSVTGNVEFFPSSAKLIFLLIVSGIVTAVPLFWFGKAAHHVSLSTLGFIQYISPSMQLLIGIFLFNEVFTTAHFICFTFVWTGLVVYSISLVKSVRMAAISNV